jgi:hypothetical protein
VVERHIAVGHADDPMVESGRAITAAVSIDCCVPTDSSAASTSTPAVWGQSEWASPRGRRA